MDLRKSSSPEAPQSTIHFPWHSEDAVDKIKADMMKNPEMFEQIYKKTLENFQAHISKPQSPEFEMSGMVRSSRSLSTASSNSTDSPPPPLTAMPITCASDLESIQEHLLNTMTPDTLSRFQTSLTTTSPAGSSGAGGDTTASGGSPHSQDACSGSDLADFKAGILDYSSSSDGFMSAGGGDGDYTVHSTNPDLHGCGGAKSKLLKDKTCLVCGDKALGYNFNAVSCESCKAFFRRNAFKEIRGRCEGKCDVTVESRSYCKKCRLAKCFKIGMKRELILNDSQKQVRRQKIHENRLRRQGLPFEPLPPVQTPTPTSSTANSPKAPVKLDPEEMTHEMAKTVDEHQLTGLNQKAIDYIHDVCKAFKLSFDAPVEHNIKGAPSNVDFLNMADASVRRLVKMAKHLAPFRALDPDDQISLLKGAVVEVLILRSSKMFDSENQGWQVKRGGANQTVQAAALQFGNSESISFFQQYQRFTMSLLQAIRKDNVVLMLMIVLAVLSPDRVNLRVRQQIENTQEEYAMVLKDYCALRYPEDTLMFPRVLQKLTDIRDINETHTRMLLHMRVEELEPLIVEIFDLNS